MEDLYQNPAGAVFDPRKKDRQVMSVSDWLVTLLLMLIPLVNLILLIVWAVSDSGNRNRANWAKAYLLVLLVSIVLSALIFVAVFSFISSSGLMDW